jgi:hypothetical protein
MSHSRAQVIFGAVGTGALCLWAATWLLLSHREQPYNGKSLSAWTDQYEKYWAAAPKSPDWAKRGEAEAAIRHIGTNAIPRLLAWVGVRDSPLKTQLLALSRRQKILKLPLRPAAYYHLKGHMGFMALGTVAKPGASDGQVSVEGMVMEGVGKPAASGLIELLHDKDTEVRATATVCLCSFAPDAKDAVPALVQALNEAGKGDFALINSSILALGIIHAEPDLVVPLLVEYVNGARKDCGHSLTAIVALGCYKEKAQSAVPAVLAYLNKADATQRVVINTVLRDLDPEGPTQGLGH